MPRLLLAVLLLQASIPARAGDRITDASFATRSEVIAPKAMAATSQPLATQIALDVMKRGGSAVDAAIAADAALGLMEPTGAGIGGDLFAIVWDAKTRKLYGLNGSGRSPRSLTLERLRAELAKLGRKDIPVYGPLPVSVPGTVDAWFELHGRFGKLPMKDILAPTVAYAREGFPVSDVIAYYWNRGVRWLSEYPGFKEQMTIDGRAPRKGETWKNPALAATLERIGVEGRDVFYKGEFAERIGAWMKENGGYLTKEDMAAHTSEWVQPLSSSYRGYQVWELPPNSQGLTALQILNILEGYDLKAAGFGSVDHVHLFTEAVKLAFADRAKFYADPAFYKTSVKELTSKSYAAGRRKLINPAWAARTVPAGAPQLDKGDTVYLTTADQDGNMVSLIQSNYVGMGSGMTPAGLGFVLQDRGQMFSLEDGHANVYAPGKRPFHTIIPAFITKDGKPWVSFGVMGGAMQPQGHAQIVMNLVDFGMNLQEAGDAPRIYWSSALEPTGGELTDGGKLYLESGFEWKSLRALLQRGHSVNWSLGEYGGYQAIMRSPEGAWYGASESRKDGAAAGY